MAEARRYIHIYISLVAFRWHIGHLDSTVLMVGYHFFLLFPPLGILGVRGIDILTKWVSDNVGAQKSRPMLVSLLLGVTLLLPVITIANEKIEIVMLNLVFDNKSVFEYRRMVRPNMVETSDSTTFIRKEDSLKGKILVFGDPLNYLHAGREPATPIVGWPWEFFLQSQWLELPRQITETNPVYIYIANRERKIMDIRQGGVKELITARYIPVKRTRYGNWFQIKRKFLQ